jgi:cytochrome c553
MFNPEGSLVLATMEGSRAVAAVPTEPVMASRGFNASTDLDGDFLRSASLFVGAPEGPTALLFTTERDAMVYSFIDRELSDLEYSRIDSALQDHIVDGEGPSSWFAPRIQEMRPSKLPQDVQDGRRLFYSATSSQWATDGAGVSCATCHFDGRNDGLTWQFEIGPRQTPSLAGQVSATAPVTWSDDVPSVQREAEITSQGRMGGAEITDDDLDAIAAFVDFTPPVDVGIGKGSTEQVLLGAEVFNRPEVGCAVCHAPPTYTDNKSYSMFGESRVNTPSLLGLGATAPYLHDGRQQTLQELLIGVRNGEMGDTSSLTDRELEALEMFLLTL